MSEKFSFTREWIRGDRIGGGGFGEVYAVESENGEQGAIKLVPKVPGADREVLFTNLGDARNVVPIIDQGETTDYWALVMPRADKSLRQHINEVGSPLMTAEAVTILKDIAVTLVDLDGKIVHRDLKPENILLLNGSWCLADFGISRYAEASTAADTQKYVMSWAYAAPERWRGDRAKAATDIYSFGIIAFELLTHSRPFPGPGFEDFWHQHLHDKPAPLVVGPARLRAMVSECLHKPIGVRPRAADVLARLERMEQPDRNAGVAPLEKAYLAVVERRKDRQRMASAGQAAEEQREQLLEAASASLQRIQGELFETIIGAAPTVLSQTDRWGDWSRLELGNARLELRRAFKTWPSAWGRTWAPAFDTIAHSDISVRLPPYHDKWRRDGDSPAERIGPHYKGRSHSLWFCDARDAGQYQWFELAFMVHKKTGLAMEEAPFSLDPGPAAAKALFINPWVAEVTLARPLEPIDVGHLEKFIERWVAWFAQGAEDQLEEPSLIWAWKDIPRNWRKS